MTYRRRPPITMMTTSNAAPGANKPIKPPVELNAVQYLCGIAAPKGEE